MDIVDLANIYLTQFIFKAHQIVRGGKEFDVGLWPKSIPEGSCRLGNYYGDPIKEGQYQLNLSRF